MMFPVSKLLATGVSRKVIPKKGDPVARIQPKIVGGAGESDDPVFAGFIEQKAYSMQRSIVFAGLATLTILAINIVID